MARALHVASGRKGEFVPFNVCAIADTMFEDALFGHVRGAFTGAMSDSTGYLRQANNGTAFFDEVSGLALASQAKLLRAIETGEFRPVGASRDAASAFRIVAATNQELGVQISRGLFREDLFHRFGKMVIRIPPLRDRKEDIPILASHFLEHFGMRSQLNAEALERLQNCTWPGNIRELRGVIEAASALSTNGAISAYDLKQLMTTEVRRHSYPELDETVRRTLVVLNEAGGDADAAAESLGIHKSTLYRRVQRARAEGVSEWMIDFPR